MNKRLFRSIIQIVLAFAFAFSPILVQSRTIPVLPAVAESHKPVCPGPASKDDAHCHARVVVEPDGSPKARVSPSGFGPAQLNGAYNLPGGAASGRPVIAIVDAYNHPDIFSDVNTYSSTFGIRPMDSCAVTITNHANPCFQKIDQRGGTSYPATNAGWALEIALDVEVAHAICQNCNILLVEADSNSFANLLAAEDRAFALGAVAVSNSWGAGEFSGQTTYDFHFNHPGQAVTVSSGDNGFGAEYPAASSYVTAVGGTTLTLGANNTYGGEAAWSGAGSGCSLYDPLVSGVQSSDASCSRRKISDVSAVADPSTGAAVYDSVRYQGRKGWFQVGGTSLSAPLIAAVYAIAGVPASTQANTLPYNHTGSLHDITTGSNGNCGGTYLCTAGTGYDGPTGLGTPNGLGAF